MLLSVIQKSIRLTLAEGRFENVVAKFPTITNAISYLAKYDPSGNLKYLEWMAKQVAMGSSQAKVVDAIQEFHTSQARLEKRDINQYANVNELLEALANLSDKQTRADKKRNAEVVYDDGTTVVIIPGDEASACLYSKGTKWCTASEENTPFYIYKALGRQIAILINKKTDEKIAWTVNHDLSKLLMFNNKNVVTKEIGFDEVSSLPPADQAAARAIMEPSDSSPKMNDENEFIKSQIELLKRLVKTTGGSAKIVDAYSSPVMPYGAFSREDAMEKFKKSPRFSQDSYTVIIQTEDENVLYAIFNIMEYPKEVQLMITDDMTGERMIDMGTGADVARALKGLRRAGRMPEIKILIDAL